MRTGLVLSGGGLRGAGHLGVMQRLAAQRDDYSVRPVRQVTVTPWDHFEWQPPHIRAA